MQVVAAVVVVAAPAAVAVAMAITITMRFTAFLLKCGNLIDEGGKWGEEE